MVPGFGWEGCLCKCIWVCESFLVYIVYEQIYPSGQDLYLLWNQLRDVCLRCRVVPPKCFFAFWSTVSIGYIFEIMRTW